MSTSPNVRLVAGDDASGMATMLGDLLADNLRDYPGRARVARMARGPIVMTASDHDRSVTLRFAGSEIAVDEGAVEGAACITGPWLDLAKLCSGQMSPFRAVAQRRLTLENVRRVDLMAAAGFVMSVPASYYDETVRSTRLRIDVVVAVATLLVLSVLAVVVARRRRVA